MGKPKMHVITIVAVVLALGAGAFVAITAACKPNDPVVSAGRLSPEIERLDFDKQAIRRAVTDIFDAYNGGDNVVITAALQRYINPEKSRLVFKNLAANLNFISVNGIVIYRDRIDFRINKFTLGDNDILFLSGDAGAVLTGFADGSASIPDRAVEKGPWKIECGVYQSGNDWFIQYIKLTTVEAVFLESYVQLPKDYGNRPDTKWPLIVFLHGAGERGGTIDDVKKMNHSIPMMARNGRDFPFVAVSPLCPEALSWSDLSYSIAAVIDQTVSTYRIDPDRIYLTGLSLGGKGAWRIAIQFPDKFAAIAPVCGSVEPSMALQLKHLPIWAFHGAKDYIVPMDEEQRAVDALKAVGGDIRYTVYPDVAHDAWTFAYPNMELYAWFLRHTRGKTR